MNLKTKTAGLFVLPMLFASAASCAPKASDNTNQKQQMPKAASIKKAYVVDSGASGGGSSSNYQSNGYPSIYGYETHTNAVYQAIGSSPTISNAYGYHDVGVKVYAGNTATNIGSSSTIKLNASSPYFDFSDATWMMPSALKSKQSTTTTTTGLMSFKVEVYQGSYRYFHAGAEVNLDSSGNIASVTYDKYTSSVTDTNCSKTLDENTIDFSKLGKIASSLYSGNYTIKVTYSYLWVYGNTVSELALIKTTATLSADLMIDYTKPSITMRKSGGNLVSSGSYSNEAVMVTATDSNLVSLFYKGPNNVNYAACGNTYTTGSASGWYYFYATDKCGNKSDEYKIYIDMDKPKGVIYVNGKEVSSGSYVSDGFSYFASDAASGIKNVYYKTPNSTSYVPYSNGTIIPKTSGDGWYEFYSVDNAGNISQTSKVFLETSTPVITIERNGEVVYTYNANGNGTIETGLYFNEGDSIKFGYSSSSNVYTSGTFNIGTKYLLNKASYPNSTYSETITSATGISSTFKFKIVRDKPTLSVNGISYEDGSIIKLNKDANIVMNIDSNIDSGSNNGYVSSNGIETSYDLLSNRNTTLTANNGEVKTYEIIVNDAAGNESTFTVIIDKEPSIGTFASNGIVIPNNGYINKPFTFTFSDATCVISKDGEASKAYNGEEITEDGTYSFVLTDEVGNTSNFKITLDSVSPKGIIYVDNKEAEGEVITNKSIYFTWDGDETCLVNGESYKKNTVISEEGVYSFVLSDKAGNSVTYTAEIDLTAPTGNEDNLKHQAEYTVSKWYEVSYKGNIDCFKDIESANAKVYEYEFNDSVTTLELDDVSKFTEYSMVASNDNPDNHDDEVRTGTYWLYKSIANKDIKLYYFDKNLLDDAIAFYSKDYVSGPHYLDGSNKASGEEVIDSMWDYEGKSYPIGNTHVLHSYGSDTAYAVKEGTNEKIPLNYDETLGSQLAESGLYEIFETDKAGNTCSYKVIIDKDSPKLDIKTETYSEDSTKEFTLEDDSMPSSKTFYLKSFEIKSIIENDPYAVVKVVHNGNISYYSKGDELPTLVDGGKYEISVYDRLSNDMSFMVYISSEEENIEFKNNGDDTKVSIDITLPESSITITSLEIYKNGEKLEGVTPDKLSYEFSKDGNYKVVLKDNFGRTIEKEYYFHKAKPTGNINGVVNGSKTNSDVSFEFDSSKYYAKVYKDGVMIEMNRKGNIFVESSEFNSGSYEIILISNDDEDNMQSYNFTIDSIAPDVVLDGVEDGKTTNGSVVVSWEDEDVKAATYSLNGSDEIPFENGMTFDKEGTYVITVVDDLGNTITKTFVIDKTVDYEVKTADGRSIHGDATTSSDVSISTNEEGKVTVIKDGETYPYNAGEYLTEEGTYLITVEDAFGNKTSFTIVIDKSVDFEMNVADGGITNDSVTINSNEKVTVTITKDGKPYSYSLGDEIKEEGSYKALITDAYGNTKEVSFQIVYKDARPSIDYDLGDDVIITKITKDGVEIPCDSNHLAFIEDGEYVITYIQNGKEYSFTLRLDTTAPEILINGVTDGGKVDGVVTLTDMNEEGTIHVYKDGQEIDYKLGDELRDYGSYKVVVTDKLGNMRTYTFTLEFQMNAWAIALISVGVLATLGVVAFIVMKRKKVFKK